MTKRDMARAIAGELGVTQAQALAIVRRVFDGIVETLLSEGRIELRNFGVFEVKRRRPRQARNPRTGERVAVPPRAVVTFRPGREMAERVARLSEGPDGAPDQGRAAIEGSTTGEREAT
jgi:integration host factor subunit beta